MGAIRPAAAARTTAPSAPASAGYTTAVGTGGWPAALASRLRTLSCRLSRTSGNSTRGRLTFSVGAMTSAVPVMTFLPS